MTKSTKPKKSTKSKPAKAKTHAEVKKTWAEKMTAEMNRLTTKKNKVEKAPAEKEVTAPKVAAGRPSKEKTEAMDVAAAKALGSRPGKLREKAIAAWREIATKAHLRKHWVAKILGPIQ